MRLSNVESIFVDESGDMGLDLTKSKRYFVFDYVYARQPQVLRKRLRRLLKKLHLKDRYPRHLYELKFNLPYTDLIQQGYTPAELDKDYSIHLPEIRSRAIRIIRDHSDGIFAAVLDKKTIRENTWNSERLGNFLFAQTMIVNIMNGLSPSSPPPIYYDKGRLSAARSLFFNYYLLKKDSYFEYKGFKLYRGNIALPLDVSSVMEPCIWAADLVSGAYYHKYANNEWTYANILTSKMIGPGERIYWEKQ